MFEKIAAFSLAFVAGSAIAGPLSTTLGGVTGALGNAVAGPTAAPLRMPALPSVAGGLVRNGAKVALPTSAVPLPGLGAAESAPGPLGVTAFQEGADGSGYDYVLNSDQLQPLADALSPLTNNVVSQTVLNGLTTALLGEEAVTDGTLFDSDHFIDDGLDNNLVTPLLGVDGDGGMVDVAAFDGNGTANAGEDGLLGAAVGSGSATGNGGAIGVGLLNEGFSGNGGQIGAAVLNQGPVTGNGGAIGVGVLNQGLSGNGGQIGVAVLSGEGSGNGGALGVGALNKNDTLHICGGGFCGSLNDVTSQAGAVPGFDQGGIAIGGGPNGDTVTSSNPLLNLGVLTGDGAGSGGAIGVAVLSGDDAAQADLLGVGVLSGDRTGSGSVSVGALSGAGSGNSDGGTLPLGVGVGALNKGLSGNGSDIGVGALNGAGSGNGGQLGVGALNDGGLSGNGGAIGVGALNGGGSGNGGQLGVGALNGAGSGNGGSIGVGAINGGSTAGGDSGSGSSGNGGIVGAGVIDGASGSGGGNNGGGNNGGGGNGGGNNGGGNGGNDGGGSVVTAENAGDEGMCALEVRDGNGRVVQIVKRPCKQLSSAKRARS